MKPWEEKFEAGELLEKTIPMTASLIALLVKIYSREPLTDYVGIEKDITYLADEWLIEREWATTSRGDTFSKIIIDREKREKGKK